MFERFVLRLTLLTSSFRVMFLISRLMLKLLRFFIFRRFIIFKRVFFCMFERFVLLLTLLTSFCFCFCFSARNAAAPRAAVLGVLEVAVFIILGDRPEGVAFLFLLEVAVLGVIGVGFSIPV